jgi:hypothetical protein
MLPEAGLLVTYDIWSDEYQAAVDEVIAEMDRLEAL